MQLEITGKLIQVLPTQTGATKSGNKWEKGGFVLETDDRFPKKVCCTVWKDMLAKMNDFKVGDSLKASIDIESREFNGRWYTDVRAWKLDVLNSASTGASDPQRDYNTSQEAYNSSPEPVDDLPF